MPYPVTPAESDTLSGRARRGLDRALAVGGGAGRAGRGGEGRAPPSRGQGRRCRRARTCMQGYLMGVGGVAVETRRRRASLTRVRHCKCIDAA